MSHDNANTATRVGYVCMYDMTFTSTLYPSIGDDPVNDALGVGQGRGTLTSHAPVYTLT